MRRSALIVALSAALAALALVASPVAVRAQDASVAIEPYRLPLSDRGIIAKAEKFKKAGKLMSIKQIEAGLKSPSPKTLDLPNPSVKPLAAREIAARARKGLLRVGWFFKCPRCSRWHLNLAGGYAITDDGAAVTCYHCVEPKESSMREGYLIALDADNNVLPVTAILGCDKIMDAAIVRVAGKDLTPLALNDRVAPGDPVYLYSDPMHVAGYFSSGMVNRFFWKIGRSGDPTTLGGAKRFRLNVSTDWAPGSSGAAILDACGNAVGHVSVISSFQQRKPAARPSPRTQKADKGDSGDKNDDHAPPPMAPRSSSGATMMTLHEAVPARAVRLLAESLVTDAGKPDAAKDKPNKSK